MIGTLPFASVNAHDGLSTSLSDIVLPSKLMSTSRANVSRRTRVLSLQSSVPTSRHPLMVVLYSSRNGLRSEAPNPSAKKELQRQLTGFGSPCRGRRAGRLCALSVCQNHSRLCGVAEQISTGVRKCARESSLDKSSTWYYLFTTSFS